MTNGAVPRIYFVRQCAVDFLRIVDFGYIITPVGSAFVLVNVYFAEDCDGFGHLELREAKQFLPYHDDNGGYIVDLFYTSGDMVNKVNEMSKKCNERLIIQEGRDYVRPLAIWGTTSDESSAKATLQ